MTGAYTPWEDVTLEDSLISRQMRINTLDNTNHSIEYRNTQNCDEILAINKALRNQDNFSGSLWNGSNWVRVAQLPLALLEQWAEEDDINFYRWNDDDKARIMRRLNDPSYSQLRTAPGRI